MATLSFRPVCAADASLLIDMLADPEAMQRLGGLLPIEPWLDHVAQSVRQKAWMSGAPVGLIVSEVDDEPAVWPAVLVARAARGCDLGTKLLAFGIDQAGKAVARAEIETDNEAALRMARRLGFVDSGRPSEAGFISMQRVGQQSGATRL